MSKLLLFQKLEIGQMVANISHISAFMLRLQNGGNWTQLKSPVAGLAEKPIIIAII